ncbi:MAG: PAS domain S-box protein [Cyanobacteria bacterium SZAS-4]|nr:PAS domain S-box protein [Cyanobacteria bacterium SZAS-4]
MKLLPKVFIVAGIPVVFGIAMMIILAYLLSAQEAELIREKNARDAVSDGMTLTTAVTSGALAVFEYSATQNENSLRNYPELKQKVDNAIARLKVSMASRPKQLSAVLQIEKQCMKSLSLSDEVVDLIRKGGLHFAPMRLREIREIVNEQVLTNKLDMEIAGLDEPYVRQSEFTVSQYRQLIGYVLYGGSAFAVLLSVVVPFLLSKQVTGRLSVIIENSKRLARRAPLLRPLNGSDEIAELDHQFHEMSELLQEISSQERAILENAGAVIFTIDQDTKIVEIAKECEKVLGFTDEDLFGRRLFSLVKSEAVNDLRSRLQSIEPGSSLIFEEEFIKRDGQIIVMLISVHNGGEHRYYCVAYDITERKELERQLHKSEAKVRSLVENLPAGLMLISRDGKIRFANQSALRLFGANTLIDKALLQRLKLKKEFYDIFELASEECGKSFLSSIESGESGEVPIELSLDFAEIDGEKYVLAIVADLTERLTIDRIKQELLRTMSDDVAQPMTEIALVLSRLRAGDLGNLTEKAYSRLDVSVNESERLLRLFDDFLKIRMGDELFAIVKAPTSVVQIVNKAMGAVAIKASPKQISLISSVTDCLVDVDPERIVQVMVNLFTNAIKFSPAQGKIDISSDIADGVVRLSVRDYGSGIPAESLGTIFEAFKQAAVTDATRKGGTGLGLAICKSIVDKHGGKIWAENNDGVGATFFVTLPLAPASSQQ